MLFYTSEHRVAPLFPMRKLLRMCTGNVFCCEALFVLKRFVERFVDVLVDANADVSTADNPQVGTRLEDFKTSRVHAAFVLKHGSDPGSRLMGEKKLLV